MMWGMGFATQGWRCVRFRDPDVASFVLTGMGGANVRRLYTVTSEPWSDHMLS